tara:strand:- start:2282 stop:3673 length:1392 start_codon:yes stop_codon:yes gene_type:complete
MKKRTTYLAFSAAIFSGLLVAAWVTHGTGIVRDDPERNIVIPDDLTSTLQVKAAYDGETIWFRYRWAAEEPNLVNDVLVYENGAWALREGSEVGPDPDRLVEDRVAMMVDDGSVPLFSRYGGYITIGDGLTSFSGVPETEEERSKYLPETRTDPDDIDTVRPENELRRLREAGYFLDLWDWRSARTNPLAQAEDTSVGAAREPDAGAAPFISNFDENTGLPRFMFDPALDTGNPLSIDIVTAGEAGFDNAYFLAESAAVPFDPATDWQEGDTLPARVLRESAGSRGDISMPAAARWRNGFWDVTLQRAMDTGDPLEDKIFRDGGSYDLAFAVFRDSATMRWHYVSLPVSFGLDQPAQFVARESEPGQPDWTGPWTEVPVFYPGQVTWDRLTDPRRHPGADRIAARVPAAYQHNERQLALYGIEMEFAEEIRRQWLWTLGMSLLLIVALGTGMVLLFRRTEETT